MAEPYLKMLSQKIEELNLPSSDQDLLECKHFFSGAALYADGKIIGSLTPVGFGLKLPADVRERLIKKGDGTELRYFEKAPVKRKYVLLSESVVDDPRALKELLDLSIRYVLEKE